MGSASEQLRHTVGVRVEARDLDTDERSVTRFEIPPPDGSDCARRELERLVAGVHPHAKLRSFAGGAATFLDSQSLVVAHYTGVWRRPSKALARAEHSEQAPLFAA